jgi:fatty acid desaturase
LKSKTKLFAHSRLDVLLVLLALVQLATLLYGALTFGAVPRIQSLVVGLVSVFLICTNFQCIAHNFIHNPFFRSRRLNDAFSLFNSLLIGGPQSLYRFHHLHHHKYNNDAPDPETGTTRDVSSTWRHSAWPGREEGFLSYALLGYFRSDFGFLLNEARKRGRIRGVSLEFAAVLGLVAAIGFLNPLGLVCFYLPVWYFGNVAAQAENFLEHYGAFPGDRKTDSVSSYGTLYNLIWFNNGYHQEHHYRPQVHWARIPEVKDLLPPESDRRVVRGAHWFNFAARREVHPRDRRDVLRRPRAETIPERDVRETETAHHTTGVNGTLSTLKPWQYP